MLLESLGDALGYLPGILAFRLFPFAGFVTLSRSHRRPVRVLVAAAYALISWLAARYGATPVHWLVLMYAYFAVACWVAYELSTHVRSNAAWLTVVVLLFWALPVIAIHPMPGTFLVLGWDYVLSAYSYGLDTRDQRERSLKDMLFFVLVNPVLVYRRRGARVGSPALDAMGIARIGLGLAVLLLADGLLEPLRVRAIVAGVTGGKPGAELLLVVGGLRVGREYALQSGVASLQIGVMRQLGYRLPERFRYPFLATSPADFWRRWNTYVGDWARLYVFVPLVLSFSGRRRRAVGAWLYALAVLVTFCAVGVLHDAFIVAAEGELKAPATKWFLAAGCLVVLWEALKKLLDRWAASSYGRAAQRAVLLAAATYAGANLWW